MTSSSPSGEPAAFAMSPAGGSYRGKVGCRDMWCTQKGDPDRCYGWHCILCDGPSNCQGNCSKPELPAPPGAEPMTPKRSKRNWAAMRAKVTQERICRVCAMGEGFMAGPLEAAHIIPRSRVKPGVGEDPRNCVPLCHSCHRAYDEGGFDLLPFLSREEQAYATELVGLAEAYRRTTNERQPA